MADRLRRVLLLLQATPLPLDLIDNPGRTGQWLVTLENLQQALAVLRGDSRTATGLPAESRGERLTRLFNRMIAGLPMVCLAELSPVIKLGLLRPLLQDLDGAERRLRGTPLYEVTALATRLSYYRSALAEMAARHIAPEPPLDLRPPETVPV
ncbi:hypothetical protein [Ferrovibrio sp.]|uniref:hypothetical protein n=1 Tax=Ferrovibrio sp. TaxID=1917215 RepID=UPI002617083B|nr:hypothetical protein [Ferrovibrio sp.]